MNRFLMLNIGAYRKFKKVMSRAHSLPLPITILYLMSGCGGVAENLRKFAQKKCAFRTPHPRSTHGQYNCIFICLVGGFVKEWTTTYLVSTIAFFFLVIGVKVA